MTAGRAAGLRGSAAAGLLLVAVLWGAVFAAGKVAVQDVPPLAVATVRFGLAALVLLPFYARERRGVRLLPQGWAAWRSLALLALTAVVGYNALFFGGLQLAPSSDSILLVPTTNPIWTTLIAALVLGERVPARMRVAMAVALGGMALVLLGGPSATFGGERLLGNLMFVAAAVVFGASHVVGRVAIRHVTPLGATTLAGVVGTLALLPVALLRGDLAPLADASMVAWLALLFIALGGTALAYVLWYRGVRQLGAGRTGFYTNLVPVFGLTSSALLLGEYPAPLQVLGGAVLLGAVVWGARQPARVATLAGASP